MLSIRYLICSLILFLSVQAFAQKPLHSYVRIQTSKGECVIMLYNETPEHRDNFLRLAVDRPSGIFSFLSPDKPGIYDGTLFHRVISQFMIQGGDPDSKDAKPGQLLGDGGFNYSIPAELHDSLFHKKGALVAAPDKTEEMESHSTQFYLVQGKTYTDEELNRIEQLKLGGRKIPVWQREIYKTIGGTPFLDQSDTVFGEVVKGIDMIDAIAGVATDENNRPLQDIKMKVTVLKNSEVKALEKELIQDSFRKKLIMNSNF